MYSNYIDDIVEVKNSGEANVLVRNICERDEVNDMYYVLNNTDLDELREVAGDKLADKLLKDMPGKFKEID